MLWEFTGGVSAEERQDLIIFKNDKRMLVGVKRRNSKTAGQTSSGDVEGCLWLLERLWMGRVWGQGRGKPKVRAAGQMVKLYLKLGRPGWFQGRALREHLLWM